jgi:hypothetical protein
MHILGMALNESGAETLPVFQHFSGGIEDNHGIFWLR